MRLLLALLLFPCAALAQPSDADAVRAHVEALFDAMRASDGQAVRDHFHPLAASMYTVGRTPDGEVVVQVGNVSSFADLVGGEHPLFDERIGPVEVRVDGDFATAFMPYAFYLGERFSHCGVNAFQLARTPEGWRTIHITDTRRRTDCDPSVAPD